MEHKGAWPNSPDRRPPGIYAFSLDLKIDCLVLSFLRKRPMVSSGTFYKKSIGNYEPYQDFVFFARSSRYKNIKNINFDKSK